MKYLKEFEEFLFEYSIREHPFKYGPISHAKYDVDSKELTLTFAPSGDDYAYLEVEEDDYDKLIRSHTPGKYFTDSIKNKYRQKSQGH